MKVELTAVFRNVPEGYSGFAEELPGANTQGATLEEARRNLAEAVRMVYPLQRPRIMPRILLKRFPSSIVFIEHDEHLWVLAFAHQHRRPGLVRAVAKVAGSRSELVHRG